MFLTQSVTIKSKRNTKTNKNCILGWNEILNQLILCHKQCKSFFYTNAGKKITVKTKNTNEATFHGINSKVISFHRQIVISWNWSENAPLFSIGVFVILSLIFLIISLNVRKQQPIIFWKIKTVLLDFGCWKKLKIHDF